MKRALPLFLLLACRRPGVEAAGADAAPEAAAPVTASASAPPPPASAAPIEDRRAALLAGHGAAALPVQATDEYSSFDNGLRKRLTTTEVEGTAEDRGEVQLGKVSASVPVPDADRVVAGLRPRFRQCYRVGRASDPVMSGKLVLVLEVAPEGEVSEVKVPSNAGIAPGVAECAMGVARRATFSAPKGKGSTLTLPLTFVDAL